jgi:hypothetical protein
LSALANQRDRSRFQQMDWSVPDKKNVARVTANPTKRYSIWTI